MAEKKTTRQRWYCTLRDGSEENRKDYWSLKRANKDPIGDYEKQDEAVQAFKDLNLDATLWFQQGGKFVRTIKTLHSDDPKLMITVDSNDDEETIKANEKRMKEVQKARKLLEAQKAKEAEKPVIKEEKSTPVKTVKPVKKEATSKKTTTKKNSSKLSSILFNSEKIYEQAIFDVVIADRASLRQGTHKVKNRAEVSGTGKKPWQQKGTGRARAGSMRNPIFVGGGRAFGPTPERNYKLKVNKKVRKNALVSALTLLAQKDGVVVSNLAVEKISTKNLLAELSSLKIVDAKTLIITSDKQVFLSARNLEKVATTKVTSISVEQLLWADKLVISSEDIKFLEGLVK